MITIVVSIPMTVDMPIMARLVVSVLWSNISHELQFGLHWPFTGSGKKFSWQSRMLPLEPSLFSRFWQEICKCCNNIIMLQEYLLVPMHYNIMRNRHKEDLILRNWTNWRCASHQEYPLCIEQFIPRPLWSFNFSTWKLMLSDKASYSP